MTLEHWLAFEHAARDGLPSSTVGDEKVAVTVRDGRVKGGIDVGAGDVRNRDVVLLWEGEEVSRKEEEDEEGKVRTGWKPVLL